ncbi:MAG: translation elongation factor Ts [Candidatus Poribacteria bacterium]|nr:translation elongation factor Ts [Candidatus Poribacteria bacterium]
MAITAKQVKELRDKTGAGIMDAKEALTETDGNMEKAIAFLREKGMKTYEKKSGRSASEGLVVSYIHPGDRIGVLLEVNCETDFVARTEAFQGLTRELAMQVAATSPQYVSRGEVSTEDLDRERQILINQAKNEGKPEAVIEKIVEGRMRKFYEERCLLDQPYIRDDKKSVETLIKEAVATLGERIVVRRFARYSLGQNSTTAEMTITSDADSE